jgi:hypothetical protein
MLTHIYLICYKQVKGGLLTQSSKTEKLFESLNVRQDRFTNSN